MAQGKCLTAVCLIVLALGGGAGQAAERTIAFTGPVLSAESSARVHEPDPLGLPRKTFRVPSPGLASVNPKFSENGFLVEAFWAVEVGSKVGHFIQGHFHPKDLATGFEGQHYGGRRELHGLFIKAEDGKPFNLKSLRCRVTRNRELPDRNRSIDGFSLYDVQILISTSFDPGQPLWGQLVPFSVGPPVGNDLDQPFSTLSISGFNEVTQVFIASSASVDFDDIVLDDLSP